MIVIVSILCTPAGQYFLYTAARREGIASFKGALHREGKGAKAAEASATERTGEGQAPEEEAQLRFDDDTDEDISAGTAQERWQRTNAYMRDVQQAFRSRPAVRVQSNERYMKLLLVNSTHPPSL